MIIYKVTESIMFELLTENGIRFSGTQSAGQF